MHCPTRALLTMSCRFAALSGDDGSNAPDPGTASEVVSQAQADAAGNDIILSVTLSRAAYKL